MKKYQQIKWESGKLPDAISEDPLWTFHQALVTRATEKKEENTDQTLWALAVVKSLIEVRLNKPFMVDAIAAFNQDLKTGAYYANGRLPDGETKYSRNTTKTSEFMKYRKATGNAASGDEYKGHILRTSIVTVSDRPKKYESLSNDLLVTFIDEKGIDGYMRPYLDAWRDMQSFSKADRDDCLDAFRKNIKVQAMGCVNDRSGTALQTMLKKVTEKTAKELQRRDFIKELQPLHEAWAAEKISELNAAFERLFAKYQGYTFYENKMEGAHFVINPQSDPQWPVTLGNKEKLKKEVVNQLSLSGDSEEEILAKWTTPEAGAGPTAPGTEVKSIGTTPTSTNIDVKFVAKDTKEAKKEPVPQFRWVPWSIVDDTNVDTKLPESTTVQILHDTTTYRMQQAKKQPQGKVKESKKEIKEESKAGGREFFHDKATVVTSANSAGTIMLTPSGLASVSVEGQVTVKTEVGLAARLIPSARALLMLGSHFFTTTQTAQQAVIAKQVMNYFNNTLQAMVHIKSESDVFNSTACVSSSIPFLDANGNSYLFVTGPTTGKTLLVKGDDEHPSYQPINTVSGVVLPLKDDHTSHVVRVSAAVWQAYSQNESKLKPVLSALIKGEDETVSTSLNPIKKAGVGISRSQLLSAEELKMGQQHAQDAKVFSLIRSDDLQPTQGSGAGPFATMPPLIQITTELKDLFTMPIETLEALLEIPKEQKEKSKVEVEVETSEGVVRKNYNHWLTRYALEGSAQQSCTASLTLANILLYKIIKQDSEENLEKMLMPLMRCFELYETTWVIIAESFVALQAKGGQHGFTLLANLQILGNNIQTVLQSFPAKSLQDFSHRVSQFAGLFKAVNDLIASTPALVQGVKTAKETPTLVAVLPQSVDQSNQNQNSSCLVM